jgi:hypothetical protein
MLCELTKHKHHVVMSKVAFAELVVWWPLGKVEGLPTRQVSCFGECCELTDHCSQVHEWSRD